jgi:hypothetical protein
VDFYTSVLRYVLLVDHQSPPEMYDQHFETLLYLRQYFGATRTEELKVQSILCTE